LDESKIGVANKFFYASSTPVMISKMKYRQYELDIKNLQRFKRVKRARQAATKGNVYRFASSMSSIKAIQRYTFN
jgi:hypothetical protein